MSGGVTVRKALSRDIEPVSRLWHRGWHDAHAAIVPAALTRLRTEQNFHERLERRLEDVLVAELEREPVGFAMLTGDELEQFYVSAAVRGAGVAQTLMQAAERALSERGVETAWLACAIGNERAARFYRKAGWTLVRTEMDPLETSAGPFELEIWRFEKALGSTPRG